MGAKVFKSPKLLSENDLDHRGHEIIFLFSSKNRHMQVEVNQKSETLNHNNRDKSHFQAMAQ